MPDDIETAFATGDLRRLYDEVVALRWKVIEAETRIAKVLANLRPKRHFAMPAKLRSGRKLPPTKKLKKR